MAKTVIVSCTSCGRDTRVSATTVNAHPDWSYYCQRCIGARGSHLSERRDRHIVDLGSDVEEDDYSEDSKP